LGLTASYSIPVLVNETDCDLLDPWVMSEADLKWLNYLFAKKYPPPQYDPITTEAWFRNVVLKAPLMFHPCRLANSFAISMMTCVPWLPAEFEVHVICVCADDGYMWEAIRLMRASIAWARQRKCKRWRLSSDTDFELGGMAKRLGATEITPRYMLEL
jgi:hypothetical protein